MNEEIWSVFAKSCSEVSLKDFKLGENLLGSKLVNRNDVMVKSVKMKENNMRRDKAKEKALMLRGEMWPEITNEDLWSSGNVGYLTIPRTMPILMSIIDDLSNGTPCGQTYFALWCRSFDSMFLEIDDPMLFAAESGFGGERCLSTWKKRMKMLMELGFIDFKHNVTGALRYVLILNPYFVVKKLKDRIQPQRYVQFISRASEIGAKEIQQKPTTEEKTVIEK